jgi:branched-subunit amino acid aminotransferase/4-amino-4-deoxychorismate lyase
MNQFGLFSRNGTILPISDASVSLLSVEYSYGYGVYETLKVRNSVLYFIDQHLERLQHSATVLGISLPFSKNEIKTFIRTLINSLQVDACNIKVLLIGGNEPMLTIFATAPLYPDRKLYKQGAKLLSYTYERLFPTAKTLNMLPSYIAYKKAKENDCYDALLIDKNGIMLEGTRTNFCVMKGTTIFKAPEHRILGGVTFLTLAHVANNAGFSIREKEISIQDLSSYDGAFITSTSTKIMPIKQIDSYAYPQLSPSIQNLMKSYEEFLDASGGIFE